jgi:diguanylate cyclase (GGDEF)-like protein
VFKDLMPEFQYPHRPPSQEAAAQQAAALIAYLQQVTETLAATSSEEEVFQVILKPALEALGAEAGTVLLLEGDQLRAVAASGWGGVVSLWQDGPLSMNSPTADAIHSGQPLFFKHSEELTAAYPSLEERTKGRATVANAVLPMLLEGQPLGVMVLDFLQAHDFLEVEQRFLRVLGAQCAIALGRVRQFQKQERLIAERTAALSAFAALTEAVGSESDLRVLALRAVEVLQGFLPELSVAYHELEDGRWKARVLSAEIDPEAAEVARAGHAYSTPSFMQAVNARKAVYVDGWNAWEEGVARAESYGAAAFYPYFQAGQPYSMLVVGTQQARRWTDTDRAIIGGVGRSLGLAIERAETGQRLRERGAELAARTRALEGFSGITRTLTPGSDPYALIRQAEELVLSMLPEGYAHYYELVGGRWTDRVQTGDVRRPALQALIEQGFDFEQAQTLYLPWTTRQPLYQNDYARGQDTAPELVAHLSTVASLPVLMNAQPVGVLVFALFSPRKWSRTDRAVMETTVRSLGLTLERSQQARHQEEERAALEAFALLTEAVGSEHDILALARQACTVLRALFEDASAVYYQLDEGDALWKAQVWTEDVPAQVQAQLTAGLTADAPMIARVLDTLEASFSEGWDMEGERIAHTEAYTSAGTFPLIVSGRVQGLISVGFKLSQRWSNREKGLLRAVGRSLTLALERAELTRQVEEERTALAAFAALTEAVGTQTDVLELARQAVSTLQITLGVNVTFYERDGELFRARVWSDDLMAELLARSVESYPLDHPGIRATEHSRQAHFVDGWDAQAQKVPESAQSGAVAFQPFFIEARMSAMLIIATPERRWTVRDRAVFLAVGRSLALALERSEFARQREAQQLAVLEARSRAERAVREADRQRVQAETMTHLAHHDALTGLPNRAGLSLRLGEAVSAGEPFALFYLDLDGFKAVNDTLGHDAGDALLVQITAVLRRELQGAAAGRDQLLARIGGDEFTVMVGGLLDELQSATIAQRLRRALDVPFRLAGQDVFVTTSTGIALFPADGQTPEELLKNADLAMYQVKRETRNGWRHYLPGMNEEARARLLLASGLRGALDRGEFQLHYQPQIDLESGEVRCLEALLRWFPAGGALVSPDQFIPAAEASGLIIPIGQWVLDTACAQLTVWRRSGFPHLRVAVNVSPVQFSRPDFTEMVQGALDRAGLEPNLLELELTERGVLADLPAVLEQFRALQLLGVQIALDDFGAGESNLGRLLHLPFDVLKLDRQLSSTLDSKPESHRFMRALQTFAASLNLELVAEGIETPAQLEAVRALGCHRAQGYLLGRPAATWPPPDDSVDALRARAAQP